MANPGSLASYLREWELIEILPPQGRYAPQPRWGITALGGTAANWAAFPPAREGKNNRLDARYLLLAYSKQRADRGGCHQPRPAQRDSDAALLNPDRGRGALRPPQALRSGWPGSQGVSPSSFWPTREPVSGGRWPPILQGARVRGRGFPPQPQWGRVPPRSRTPPYHGREYSGDLGNPSMAPANLPSTPRLHLLPWSNSPGVLGLGRSLSGQAEIQASLDQLPRCPRTRPKPLRPS